MPSTSQNPNSTIGASPLIDFYHVMDGLSNTLQQFDVDIAAPVLKNVVNEISLIVLSTQTFNGKEKEVRKLLESAMALNSFLKTALKNVVRSRLREASEELVPVANDIRNGGDMLKDRQLLDLLMRIKFALDAIVKPRPQFLTTFLDRCRVTLKVVEKASDAIPVPGVKAVIGSIILIMEQSQKASEVEQQLKEATNSIEILNALFTSITSGSKRGVSLTMRKLLNMATARFEEIQLRISKHFGKGRLAKWLDADTDKQFVIKIIEDIKVEVANLSAGVMIQTQEINSLILEDGERALINRMPHVTEAIWRADSDDFDYCLDGTRVSVLDEIQTWFSDLGAPQILVLKGPVGHGKSTIASTVTRLAAEKNMLAASFFCDDGEAIRKNAKLIFPTLAYQLVPRIREKLLEYLRTSDDGLSTLAPAVQLDKLIIDPLKHANLKHDKLLLTIDALDVCKTSNPRARDKEDAILTILKALSQSIHDVPYLKVIVTCRPEQGIRRAVDTDKGKTIRVLDLVTTGVTEVSDDMKKYLIHRLDQIRDEHSNPPPDWPRADLVEKLCKKADGMFIFATVACRSINVEGDLEEQLEQLADLSTEGEGAEGIDDLYIKILKSVIERNPGQFKTKTEPSFSFILGMIILAQNPMSLEELSSFFKKSRESIFGDLSGLHSVLILPRNAMDNAVIRVVHKSFRDFLTDNERCEVDKAYVDSPRTHVKIVLKLFSVMQDGLKKGESPDKLLSYASRHWAEHLLHIPHDHNDPSMRLIETINELEKFVYSSLLLWIEALSTIGSLGSSISGFLDVGMWYSQTSIHREKVEEILNDGQRLVREFFEAIAEHPSHLYDSALPLVPIDTALAKVYANEYTSPRRTGIADAWDSCLRAIKHSGDVSSVAISPDGSLLASATTGGHLNVWIIKTGELKLKIDVRVKVGKYAWIKKVYFLPDGNLCTYLEIGKSGSAMVEKVFAWKTETSELIDSWPGRLVLVSPSDQLHVATLMDDGIRLYDLETRLSHTHIDSEMRLKLWQSPIRSAIWSDQLAKHWKSLSQIIGTDVTTITLSEDGKYVAWTNAFLPQKTTDSVRIIDLTRLDYPMTICESVEGDISTIPPKFSHDGKNVAAVFGTTIFVWDTTSGELKGCLRGHTDLIRDLNFSTDDRHIISASSDSTVRIWHCHGSKDTKSLLEISPTKINKMIFSENGEFVASGSRDGTLRMWNSDNGALIKSWNAGTVQITSLAFASKRQLLASLDITGSLSIWSLDHWMASTVQLVSPQAVTATPQDADSDSDSLLCSAMLFSNNDDQLFVMLLDRLHVLDVTTLEKNRSILVPTDLWSPSKFVQSCRQLKWIAKITQIANKALAVFPMLLTCSPSCNSIGVVTRERHETFRYWSVNILEKQKQSTTLPIPTLTARAVFKDYASGRLYIISSSGEIIGFFGWNVGSDGSEELVIEPCDSLDVYHMTEDGWVGDRHQDKKYWVAPKYFKDSTPVHEMHFGYEHVVSYGAKKVAMGGETGWVSFIDSEKSGFSIGRVTDNGTSEAAPKTV